MTTKQNTIESQLLPEPLAKAAGPEVLEARDRAATALQAREHAIEARHKAAAALAGADAEDDAAMGAALDAGRHDNPKPTKPDREREFDVSVKRENKANEQACDATAHYTRVLVKHGEALAREQRPRFEREGEKLAALLAQLQEQLARYAYEGGLLRSLASPRAVGSEQAADRRAMLGRAPVPELPRFDPLVMPSLAELHEAVGRLAWSAFPIAQPHPRSHWQGPDKLGRRRGEAGRAPERLSSG